MSDEKWSAESVKAAVLAKCAEAYAAEEESEEPYHSEYHPDWEPSYEDLIALGCDEVVVSASFGDYQGDSHVIGRRGTQYGFQTYGWGSCSGCDALEGCRTAEDLAGLAVSMATLWSHWADSAEDMLKWIEGHDWEGQWSFYAEREEEARKTIIAALRAQIEVDKL